MNFSTFRQSTEHDLSENKFDQLEQNLRGLTADQNNYEQILLSKNKKRSLSRDSIQQSNNQLIKRRQKMKTNFEQQDCLDIQLRNQIEKYFESYPWQSFIDNLRISLEAKILLLEDKLVLLQNAMSTRIEEIHRKIDDNSKTLEKVNKQVRSNSHQKQQQEEELNVNQLFRMVKKCIDNQTCLYKELQNFKEQINQKIHHYTALKNIIQDNDLQLNETKILIQSRDGISTKNLTVRRSQEKLEKYNESEEQPFDRSERNQINQEDNLIKKYQCQVKCNEDLTARQQSDWNKMYRDYFVKNQLNKQPIQEISNENQSNLKKRSGQIPANELYRSPL